MPITCPKAIHQEPLEPYIHPRSHQRLKRQLLGACMIGRLAIKRSDQTGGSNLFWIGIGKVTRDAFDQPLRRTLTIHSAGQPVELGRKFMVDMPIARRRLSLGATTGRGDGAVSDLRIVPGTPPATTALAGGGP